MQVSCTKIINHNDPYKPLHNWEKNSPICLTNFVCSEYLNTSMHVHNLNFPVSPVMFNSFITLFITSQKTVSMTLTAFFGANSTLRKKFYWIYSISAKSMYIIDSNKYVIELIASQVRIHRRPTVGPTLLK